MDSTRFDSLTRFLNAVSPRRAALAALGGVFGLLGIADAAHGKRKKRKKRKKRRKNTCTGENTCRETAFCDARAECACFVPASGGKAFCGSAFPRSVASCDACLASETCVDLAGPGVPCNIPGLACVPPCPNPTVRPDAV